MAEHKTGSWDAMVKRNALWLQSFWFVRGVMGTMALVALIPQVTELEQIEVLRALYALIIGWNDVMAWIGRMIGEVPFLPSIPHLYISFAVFISAVSLPTIFVEVRYIIRKFQNNLMVDAMIISLKRRGKTAFGISREKTLDIGAIIASLIIITNILYIVISMEVQIPQYLQAYLYVFFAFGVLILTYYASRHLPGFKSGLLFTLGIAATITIGYNIGTTNFSDWVNATVCAELGIAPADCSPD